MLFIVTSNFENFRQQGRRKHHLLDPEDTSFAAENDTFFPLREGTGEEGRGFEKWNQSIHMYV